MSEVQPHQLRGALANYARGRRGISYDETLAAFDAMALEAENWRKLLVLLPEGVALNYMSPNYVVNVKEKYFIETIEKLHAEALKAVPE